MITTKTTAMAMKGNIMNKCNFYDMAIKHNIDIEVERDTDENDTVIGVSIFSPQTQWVYGDDMEDAICKFLELVI